MEPSEPTDRDLCAIYGREVSAWFYANPTVDLTYPEDRSHESALRAVYDAGRTSVTPPDRELLIDALVMSPMADRLAPDDLALVSRTADAILAALSTPKEEA